MGAEQDFERARVRSRVREALFGDQPLPPRLGRFTVLERIGSGGSSHVYSGYDATLDRRVALKLLHRGHRGTATPDSLRERLIREGKALAKLSHPNVLRVHEIGTHGSDVFLAVELVDGRDLTGWLHDANRSWTDVVEVMREAGAGLQAAHAIGLVHRDVKPQNVLVDRAGRVRIADFGLVQAPGHSVVGMGGDDVDAVGSLTATGATVGSPAYMAPEQWQGGEVDARTDQFGFCVSFYEALHGVRPFTGATRDALAEAVVSHRLQVPPDDRDVPDWLDDIVTRGLEPTPGDRYPSMSALLDDLDARARSHELVHEAQRALTSSELDTPDFALTRSTARVALERALSLWAGNPSARRLRAEVLVQLFGHELRQGALETADTLLAEMDDAPAELREELARARHVAERKEQGLATLEQLEHDEDQHLLADRKVRWMLVRAAAYPVGFISLGVAARAGVVSVGTPLLGLYFLVFALGYFLAIRLRFERFGVNKVIRTLATFAGCLNVGGVLVAGFAWWMDVSLAETMVLIQAMLTALWGYVGLVTDKRVLVMSPIALVSAIAIALWPDYVLDVYGVSSGVALAAVALSWRVTAGEPVAKEGS